MFGAISELKDTFKMWFEFGKSVAKMRRGQLTMAAVGGIAGLIMILYVLLLVISKFRPAVINNIGNDTVAQEMLAEVDENTKSSLSMTSMVPFIAAIALVLGLLFSIFRS